MRTTELGEVTEATVVIGQTSAELLPSAANAAFSSSKRHGVRPVLKGALTACCTMLAALVLLHVYAQSLPEQAISAYANTEIGKFSDDDVIDVLIDERGFLSRAGQSIMTKALDFDGMVFGYLENIPFGSRINKIAEGELDDNMVVDELEPTSATSAELGEAGEAVVPVSAIPSRALEEMMVVASRSGDSSDAGAIIVGDKAYNYTRRLFMESTAYTWTGNKTATGTWPSVGTIAVDPNFIPLGTKLYVEGYGFGIAADTGGLINGNIIDVYFDTRPECLIWGRKHGVMVFILE
ncbi:MAG: 3D domain-containing protein [Clostridiales bacterium]|nr:3D domain-containing protein [Clostridiales bacterium]